MSLDLWIVAIMKHNPTKKFWWEEGTGYWMECTRDDQPFFPKFFNGKVVGRSWGKISQLFILDEEGNRNTLLFIRTLT